MKKLFKKNSDKNKLILLFSTFVVLAAVLAFAMLSSAGFNPSEYLLASVGGSKNNPVIGQFPAVVSAGKIITITGTGFTPTANRVHIGKKQVNGVKSFEKGTSLIFEIPLKKDLPNGTYPLFVRNARGTSNTVSIEITGAPANSFTPSTNTPGTNNTLTVDLKVASGSSQASVPSDGPITIPYDSKIKLSWTTTNAKKCTGSDAWKGIHSTRGSNQLSKLKTSGTYTLTCSGKGGSASASDSVTVNVGSAPSTTSSGKPTVALKVNGSDGATIAVGTSADLSWTSTNATTCWATGGWDGISAPDWGLAKSAPTGSDSTGSLTAAKTYYLQCYNAAGVVSSLDSVTVNVTAP